MKQMTLAAAGFERYAKTTRRAVFLAEMKRVVPWPALCGLIEPFYPKAGNGRPPVGVERMLGQTACWMITGGKRWRRYDISAITTAYPGSRLRAIRLS